MTTTVPRDLPEKPSQPTYYTSNDRVLNRLRIFLHSVDGTWRENGQPIDADQVPHNLRPLALEVTR